MLVGDWNLHWTPRELKLTISTRFQWWWSKLQRYTENPTLNEDSKPHKKGEQVGRSTSQVCIGRFESNTVPKWRNWKAEPITYTWVIHWHHSQPPILLCVKLRRVWHKEDSHRSHTPPAISRCTKQLLQTHHRLLHWMLTSSSCTKPCLCVAAPKSERRCKHLQLITLGQEN